MNKPISIWILLGYLLMVSIVGVILSTLTFSSGNFRIGFVGLLFWSPIFLGLYIASFGRNRWMGTYLSVLCGLLGIFHLVAGIGKLIDGLVFIGIFKILLGSIVFYFSIRVNRGQRERSYFGASGQTDFKLKEQTTANK